MKHIFLALLLGVGVNLCAQPETESDSAYYANYNQRISQTHLNGFYIPENMQDAFATLDELSDPAGLEKFKQADEVVVAQKLKGGLGRWMLINWGFHEGSRFSHYLKNEGILHPEDMAQCMIVSYHRHLNGRPIDLKNQAEAYAALRRKEYEKRIQPDTTFTLPKKNR